MRVIQEVDDAFWLDVAGKSRQATFFHTPHWRDLAIRTYPEYADASVAAILDDGTRVVLPLLETGRSGKGLLRHVMSTFGGCYGGLISDSPVSPDGVAGVYEGLLGGLRVDSLQLTTGPLSEETPMPDRFEASPYSTHLLPLDEGWEAVERRFSRGNRASINRGRRMGVTTRVATSLEEYRAYYAVYERSLSRWGERATSRYPWRLFEEGCEMARSAPERIKLWIASVGTDLAAGAWVFYWNRHAVYWHGATDVAFADHRPANVLHADIIRDCCRGGGRYYDFNPSGGHEGVARFKSRFGASLHPIRVWRYRSKGSEVLGAVRRLFH